VAGGIVIAVVLVLVMPPAFFATGAVLSALLGWLLWDEAEAAHEGSELIALNR